MTKEVDDLVATLARSLFCSPHVRNREQLLPAQHHRGQHRVKAGGERRGRAIKLQTKVIVTAATAQGWAKQGCRLREFCSLCCLPRLP